MLCGNNGEIRPRDNLKDIDIFRGVAALVVAAFHTREITWVGMREFWGVHGLVFDPGVIISYATFPLVWGGIGVPVFFVLSGYCIHRSQALARVRHASFRLSPGNFLLRRFCRIYPVLLVALAATFICDWLSRHFPPVSDKLGDTGIVSLLVNIFSLQGVLGKSYGSNGPLWTLSIEVQFYLLYPLFLALIVRLGQITTLIALMVLSIVSFFVFERNGYQLFSTFYCSWYLGALVAEFEVGTLGRSHFILKARCDLLYGISFMMLCLGCAIFFGSSYAAFQIWALAFAIFLFAFLKSRRQLGGVAATALRKVGAFSFSLYIIHVPIIVLTQSVIFASARQEGILPFFITLLFVIGCAYVFSLGFERPALELSRRVKSTV